MTYKAIDATLIALSAVTPPRLVRFAPEFDADESEKRELWMPPSLRDSLYQKDKKKSLTFSANIRAFIGMHVKGKPIDNNDYMKSWVNDVWELRVQNQPRRERVRIFGAFAKPDVFIAMFQKPRSHFGDKDDPKWKASTDRTVNEWNKMFPGCNRVPARPFSNCVTFEAYDIYGG